MIRRSSAFTFRPSKAWCTRNLLARVVCLDRHNLVCMCMYVCVRHIFCGPRNDTSIPGWWLWQALDGSITTLWQTSVCTVGGLDKNLIAQGRYKINIAEIFVMCSLNGRGGLLNETARTSNMTKYLSSHLQPLFRKAGTYPKDTLHHTPVIQGAVICYSRYAQWPSPLRTKGTQGNIEMWKATISMGQPCVVNLNLKILSCTMFVFFGYVVEI